ncbi:c-type cytochrome [Desulfofustis glycolicus]|uniref:Cytochrome C oxidase, cbb3-type, subunit III n=1 Tax=Desulfofustis glycolicus DSM 9705 TaxID=1121409 RepID=A0A1M5Y2F3_9BACT|nr:c-type cytochrome [Desulfofustis glycolicus]SHI05673.1 Cytochrome C oxidase, cbb3-type, subunit III [Desulfofustis glycolicus DSM 9705]
MNYPVWYLPEIGGGLLIALIAVLHVFVSHFAVGGGLYLIYAEKKGLREHNDGILAFTKRHARFFLLLTLVFGSITGVGIWFIIALVNPAATSLLIHIFVFGWAVEWVFFLVEIVAAFVYFYMFGKMNPATHLKVGWVYFISAWMSLFLINGIIGFMLTPGSWLENGNFWNGFFNPSFWPSLGLRTFIALMLAGVYGYLTASFCQQREVRLTMTRFSGKWALGALVAALPFAWWYVVVLPEPAQKLVFGTSPTIAAAAQWGAVGAVALLVITLVAGIVRPALNLRSVAALAMVCGLITIGSFEWIREAARRPYAINEVIYSNMIKKEELERITEQGYLQTAVWVEDRQLTDQSRPTAGEELFIQQCYACHTAGGWNNDLKAQTARMSYPAMSSYIKRIHEVRYFMPPFAGTDAEADALAAYLVGSWHGKEEAPAGTENAGEQLFDAQCAACHAPEDLTESLGGLPTGEIVDLLGRLDEISTEMEPFSGSGSEAVALAAFLRVPSGGEEAVAPATPDGEMLFADNCAVCHAPEDVAAVLESWERGAVRAALDDLQAISEEMPPYDGTADEKDALTDYLIDLGRNP